MARWAFEEFLDTEVGAAESDRLGELRLVALEDRIEADLRLGGHRELVAELEGLVRGQPLRERLWAQLLLALYRSGRQADALLAYQRARTVLVEELGIDPGAELRRLHAAILAQDLGLDLPTPAEADPSPELPFGQEEAATQVLSLHEAAMASRAAAGAQEQTAQPDRRQPRPPAAGPSDTGRGRRGRPAGVRPRATGRVGQSAPTELAAGHGRAPRRSARRGRAGGRSDREPRLRRRGDRFQQPGADQGQIGRPGRTGPIGGAAGM